MAVAGRSIRARPPYARGRKGTDTNVLLHCVADSGRVIRIDPLLIYATPGFPVRIDGRPRGNVRSARRSEHACNLRVLRRGPAGALHCMSTRRLECQCDMCTVYLLGLATAASPC